MPFPCWLLIWICSTVHSPCCTVPIVHAYCILYYRVYLQCPLPQLSFFWRCVIFPGFLGVWSEYSILFPAMKGPENFFLWNTLYLMLHPAPYFTYSLWGARGTPPPSTIAEKKVGVADFGLFLGLLLGSRLICMAIFWNV